MNKYTNVGIDILINITILFFISSIFFIFIISDLLKNTFQTNAELIINDNLNKALIDINNNNDKLHKILNYIPINNIKNIYNKANKYIINNNNWLYIILILINIFNILLVTSIILIIKYINNTNFDVDFINILIFNIIVYFFVCLILYIFFINVSTSIVPIIPSEFIEESKQHIINNLNNTITTSNNGLEKLKQLINLSKYL